MFCGVTFFSIMMSGFISIVMSIKGEMGDSNEKQLDKWFLLIRRFHMNFKNSELKIDLRNSIENHFKYFWENHRSATLLE
jgi:hypothetical protein